MKLSVLIAFLVGFSAFAQADEFLGFLDTRNGKNVFEVTDQHSVGLGQQTDVQLPIEAQKEFRNQKVFVRLEGQMDKQKSKLIVSKVKRENFDPLNGNLRR